MRRCSLANRCTQASPLSPLALSPLTPLPLSLFPYTDERSLYSPRIRQLVRPRHAANDPRLHRIQQQAGASSPLCPLTHLPPPSLTFSLPRPCSQPPSPTAYPSWQSTYVAYGMAYGLLAADMIERFHVHYFGMSAHTYTRGTWTTPEATHPDRDIGSTDYVAAGVHTAPTYLKWMLLFEEVGSRTMTIAKAVPRDWLAVGASPIEVRRAPTRYGRLSYRLEAKTGRDGSYSVSANVTLPRSFVGEAGPAGGVRLRLRAPLERAGGLTSVTVGGKPWSAFDATAEEVVFAQASLSSELLVAMQHIVAEWA